MTACSGPIPRRLGHGHTFRLILTTITALASATVGAAAAITIDRAPEGGVWSAGATVTLSVEASSAEALSWQWRKDGVALPGATGATLSLPDAHAGLDGIYDVVIRSGPTSTTAPAVWVQVGETRPPTALVHDETFAPRIERSGARILRLTTDRSGGVVLQGTFSSIDGVPRRNLARLDANGAVDPAFTGFPPGLVYPRVMQADGKLLVLHQHAHDPALGRAPVRLERLLVSGQLDPSFSPPADLNNVQSVDLLPDGRILISQPGLNSTALLLPNGSPDGTFSLQLTGDGINPDPPQRVVQPDGRIIMWSTAVTTVNGTPLNGAGVFRIGPDGALDPTFRFSLRRGSFSSHHESITAIAPLSDRHLWVLGRFWPGDEEAFTQAAVLRLDADGSFQSGVSPRLDLPLADSPQLLHSADHLWLHRRQGPTSTFAPLRADGSLGPATVLERYFGFWDGAVATDGSLYLAEFSANDLLPPQPLLRLTVNGETTTVRNDWVLRQPGIVLSADLTLDGKILIAGNFDTVNGVPRRQIARLQPDGRLDPDFAVTAFPDAALLQVLSQADGKVVVRRQPPAWDAPPDDELFRLHPDGSRDTAFNPTAALANLNPVTHFTAHPHGGLLVTDGWNMVRLDPDGAIDPSLAPVANVRAMQVAPDGTIYAAEGATIVRLDPHGQPLPGSALAGTAFLLHPAGHITTATSASILLTREDGSVYPARSPSLVRFNRALNLETSYSATFPRSHQTANIYHGPGQLLPRPDGGLWLNDPLGPYAVDAAGRLIDIPFPDVTASGGFMASPQVFLPVADEGILIGGTNVWLNNDPVGGLVRVKPHSWTGILRQPASADLDAGNPLRLSVDAGTAPNLSYQWYRNGLAIAGETDATYTVASASASHAGHYQVVVRDGIGVAHSALAVVNVRDPADTHLFSTYVSQATLSPAAPHILVFRIEGSGPLPLLLRALGPALTTLAVTDAVTAPTLRLLDRTGKEIVTNRGWDQEPAAAAALAAAAQAAGALPLAPGSADAAILAELPAGQYFLVATADRPGRTVVELHRPGTASDSARWTYVGAWHPAVGRTPLQAGGFTVDATTPRDVLVRVLGPSLTPLIRATDPQLVLRQADGSAFPAGFNDNWADLPALAAIADRAGLIPLRNASLDAALVRPFDTAAVTIEVTNASAAARPALVETVDPTAAAPAPTGPTLMLPLLDQRVREGTPVGWSPWATGNDVLTYQWFKDGEPLPDATVRTLSVGPATPAAEGRYTLTVTDAAGSLTTAPVTLSVFTRPEHHDTDIDQDRRISLNELLRAVELYNTRAGTIRTGRYHFVDGSGDGFAADPSGAGATPLARYHTADFDRDGQFSLNELLRVIALYNTRSGTTRTGAYRLSDETTDGYAPDPG